MNGKTAPLAAGPGPSLQTLPPAPGGSHPAPGLAVGPESHNTMDPTLLADIKVLTSLYSTWLHLVVRRAFKGNPPAMIDAGWNGGTGSYVTW